MREVVSIEEQIQELRNEINKLMADEYNKDNAKLLELSQKLDEAIYECITIKAIKQ